MPTYHSYPSVGSAAGVSLVSCGVVFCKVSLCVNWWGFTNNLKRPS